MICRIKLPLAHCSITSYNGQTEQTFIKDVNISTSRIWKTLQCERKACRLTQFGHNQIKASECREAQHSPRRYQVVSEWLNGVSEGAAVMEVQRLESELIVETGGGVQKGESVRWDKCLHFL